MSRRYAQRLARLEARLVHPDSTRYTIPILIVEDYGTPEARVVESRPARPMGPHERIDYRDGIRLILDV